MTRALPLLFVVACGNVTVGEQGNFSFQDLTVTADEGAFEGRDGLDIPLAVGAEMTVQVRKSDLGTVSLVGASTEDGAILEVVSAEGDEVVVRGVGSGTTRLLVQGQELEDSVEVEVAAVGTAELMAIRDGTLFQAFAPPPLADTAFALRPGARFGLAGLLYSTDDRLLTGNAPVTWTTDAAELTPTAYERVANGAWFDHVGGAGAREIGMSLDGSPLASFPVQLLGEDASVTLRIYAPDMATVTPLNTLDLEAGTAIFGLLGFDADERLVVPALDDQPVLTILEGPADLLTLPEYAPALFGMSARACPGEGRVRIEFLGGTVEYDVAVTGEAPADCGG